MSAPQIGDVITTAEELDALPTLAALAHDAATMIWVHWGEDSWGTDGYEGDYKTAHVAEIASSEPLILVYLPGQPPRPERVVKAEALREEAARIRDAVGPNGTSDSLDIQADRIERGDQ